MTKQLVNVSITRVNEIIDFGITDLKGRKVGVVKEVIKTGDIAERAEGEVGSWHTVPNGFESGTVAYVRGISCRDGKAFGSADITGYGAKLEAAEADFAKRVEKARKLAVKKFSK